jgi:hypothetical protein
MSYNPDDNNTDGNTRESIDKKESKLATLKVAEAEQKDVGRKIARVDPEIIERFNITSGDALELVSPERKTTVLSWPAKDTDRGKHLIRIDGYIRNRLNVGINDIINDKKVDTKDAKSITFAPTEPLRIVGAEEYVSNQELSMYKTIAEQFGKPELTDGWRKKVKSDINSPSIT